MKKVLFLIALIPILIFGQVETSFEGIQFSGEKPPDPVIAVGGNHVVLAVNYRFEIYNKSGTFISGQSFSNFFSSVSPQPTGAIFDPKITYDQYSNRYILLAIDKSHRTRYLLAVTTSDDPTGSWYKYSIQGTLYDLDYPGLGFDENTIVLTSDSRVGSNSFSPDLTILNKQEIYSNNKSYQKDIRDISNGSKLKPARVMGVSPSKFYLVNTTSDGKVRIWSISNPLGGNPSLSLDKTITFANYQPPQNAVQKGESEKIEINTVGSSISDVVCKDGIIYGAYTVANTTGTGSSVKYFSADINNNFQILDDDLIESTDTYYYYPVIHPDGSGNIILVFNKSSSNDYAGIAYTKHIKNNTTHGSINWLKQGAAGYKLLLEERNRWGDYSGIALDPENSYRIWIYGEWAKTSTTWSTWVGKVNTAETKNFYFTNKYQDNNLGGSLTIDNNPPISSGNSIPLETGTTYNAKTNDERFPNWGLTGINYKHNKWNDAAEAHYLGYSFEANSDKLSHDAMFDKLLYSKIAISAEGSLQPNDGDISFQDPWYVKSDGSQPGNYWSTSTNGYYEPNGKEGASEKGVFLNQTPDPNDPNKPYYSVKTVSTQDVYLSQTGKTHKFYFLNWSANPSGSAEFQNSTALETPVVFKDANATVQANLKGTQLTNNLTTYSNNSQRKIINSYYAEGLISIYESMGKIWLERSTDGGTTWELLNNGQPINGNTTARNPSICLTYDQIRIGIAFQEDLNTFLSIRIIVADIYQGRYNVEHSEVIDAQISHSYNSNPVITSQNYINNGVNTLFFVTWNIPNQGLVTPGIHYILVEKNSSGIYNSKASGIIPNTNSSSFNPSVVSNITETTNPEFHFVWQQDVSSNIKSIKYYKISVAPNYNLSFDNYSEPSAGRYALNYKPSIAITLNRPRVCWITEHPVTYISEAALRTYGGYWGSIRAYTYSSGDNVESVGINNRNTEYGLVMAYGGDGREIRYTKGFTTTYEALPTQSNKDVQVSNGNDFTDMFISSLKTTSVPFLFEFNQVDESLNKSSSTNTSVGRSANITTNNSLFYCTIKDVVVDGEQIAFIEIPEEAKIISPEILMNDFLVTEEFKLKNKSAFTFKLSYGSTIDEQTKKHLSMKNEINFIVELIDAKDQRVIETLDKIIFNENNLARIEEKSYEVNTGNIKTSNVKVKLRIEKNFDSNFTIADVISDKRELPKKGYIHLDLKNNKIVTEYSLNQNYPNPFNPSTTISYQIKETGNVNIKIYDALGREITTLVNETKQPGNYSVTFEANNITSGIYFVRMQANKFTATKKIILAK